MKFEREKATASVEIMMTESEKAALKAFAREHGLTMTSFIKRALDTYIKILEQEDEPEEA